MSLKNNLRLKVFQRFWHSNSKDNWNVLKNRRLKLMLRRKPLKMQRRRLKKKERRKQLHLRLRNKH
jgi:hypothetical protein